ncbi:MAG: radical SAM protein [Terriglobia bacterium]
MGPTGDQQSVLQIHPTRRCNLRCLHCYSSSAPEERGELEAELLRDALTDAAGEGFTVAGFSGGEPVLYKPLASLLDHAHRCGLLTTVTSNGMLLDEPRLAMLKERADLLAISLDGVPASHNRVRACDRAFEVMKSRLEGVRSSGIPFGFIFTLTQYNLDELEWAGEFALEQGAKLLQIHPLEEVGRASEAMPGNRPDDTECAYAFLEAARIQSIAGTRLFVQLDLVHRELLRAHPDRVFAGELAPDIAQEPLGRLVSPLVVETDGAVVPMGYGFARQYALGNLRQARLSQLAVGWRRVGYPALRRLCRNVFEEATAPREFPYFNWYEAIARKSFQSTSA